MFDIKSKIKVFGKSHFVIRKGYTQFSKYYKYCEPEHKKLWATIAKNNWTVLDIGANVGIFSIILAKFVKKVYAFEPTDTANFLENNLKENNIKNVEVIRKAVANKNGKFVDKIYKIYGEDAIEEKFDFIKVDDFVKNNNLIIDAMKIDTDSYDYEVLLGAEQTLKEQSPVIVVEVIDSVLALRNVSSNDIVRYMESLNYKKMAVIDKENYLFIKNGDING